MIDFLAFACRRDVPTPQYPPKANRVVLLRSGDPNIQNPIPDPVKMVYIPPTYISTPSHLYKYPGVLQLLKVPVGLSARVLQLLKIPVDLSVHPLMVVGAPRRFVSSPTYGSECFR